MLTKRLSLPLLPALFLLFLSTSVLAQAEYAGLSKSHHHPTCANIESYGDQCAFVKASCHGFSGVFLQFYYCSPLWKPITVGLLASMLLLLFGAVSVVASDFFCPNLQTISAKLQLSESMAGVTVLAFGNGSPDLFSTFSAMDSGAGSLALGELIGAAFFIVAIVTGSMGIIRPFKSKRITFMRDATFLTGAIMMITWIVYHQRIYWYHSVALVLYYLLYVAVVVLGTYAFPGLPSSTKIESKSVTQEMLDETSRLLGAPSATSKQSRPPRLSIPTHGFSANAAAPGIPPAAATAGGIMTEQEHHLGHIIRPMTARSLSRPSLQLDVSHRIPRTTSTNGSISSRLYRQPMTPRVGIRTSLFGAIEFRDHVRSLTRASSTTSFAPSPRQRQTSVPYHFNKRGGLHSSLPYSSRPHGGGARPRASTVTDQLLHTHRKARSNSRSTAMTPDSTHSSTGLAEDYFTYISTNEPQRFPLHVTEDGLEHQHPHPSPYHHHQHHQHQYQQPVMESRGAPELPIPEIRLAQPDSPSEPAPFSAGSQLQFHTPQQYHPPMPIPSPRHSTSLSIAFPRSPSVAESDVFVSARQSPEVSPSPSMYQGFHDPTVRSLQTPVQLRSPTHPDFQALTSLPIYLEQIQQALFPTMHGWSQKSFVAKVNACIAIPIVFIFTITLPVAEPEHVKVDSVEVIPDTEPVEPTTMMSVKQNSNYLSVMDEPLIVSSHSAHSDCDASISEIFEEDEPERIWCRWLLAVQAVFGTTFLSVIMAVNEFIRPQDVVYGTVLGCIIGMVVFYSTEADKPPKWFWMLSFAGFFVALNWIFLLANEMVGLLKAIGMIFNISDSIMGLTVFALGNSIGDLVANTAIAKMGFPTMAISACYAGPLLNMVLGVGISSSYQIFKSGKPYELDIAPTILVSAGGLITVLLSTLIVVNLNGYCMNKKLGMWMIGVYVVCCITNVSLEVLTE